MNIPARLWLLTLAAFLFCSGLCALVYQVLWIRILGWTFGVTVYAASAVWAAFMAGLAIGSLAAGAVGDRVRHPLRWFGVTEILIGITAMSSPAALELLQRAYVSLYPSLPHSLGALTAVRLAIACAALIVPTALMGATLPLVLKASAFRQSARGRQIGILYGSNALGAIVGTIAAGLYLIPGRGIHDTFLIAAGLNILVGAAALALSVAPAPLAPAAALDAVAQPMSPGADHLNPAAPDVSPGLRETVRSRAQLGIVLGVFALSGVVSLALEVVWFRVLTLFLRPTVYGFAVMLATILAGIALGSYLITPWLGRRRMRWMAVLACLELAIGTAAVCSFGPLTYLPVVSRQLTPVVSRIMPEYLAYPISASLLAIFPTALLMGMAFPIGLHVWTSGLAVRRAAARIGLFYSLNVMGAIVGSLVAGFVLLPRLGSRTSLIGLAAASFASGLVLLSVSELRRPVRGAV